LDKLQRPIPNSRPNVLPGESARRPILLTGSHRSGSTWVGKMIAASDEVGYIWEPFNVRHHPGICRARFRFWFTYVPTDDDGWIRDDFRRTLEFRYSLIEELSWVRSAGQIRQMLADMRAFARYRSRSARPLLKDPIALFSAEWIARRFGADVAIVIRHPAAFASSLKRAGWRHDFSHFLKQTRLMEEHLASFAPDIEKFARYERDIVDQAGLLWCVLHHMIDEYRERFPSWVFVRHEDLSRHRKDGFAELFRKLDLEYTPKATARVGQSTSAANPAEQATETRAFHTRDSAANVDNWKRRLTSDEILRVRRATDELASKFYGVDEW
jgi:hypothetical protein